MDRVTDWRIERARKKEARDLEKKRAAAANAKPVVTAQLHQTAAVAQEEVPAPAQANAPLPVPLPNSAHSKTGIERMFEPEEKTVAPQPLESTGSRYRRHYARRCRASRQDDHAQAGRRFEAAVDDAAASAR